jgi:uncharacterized membrane protein YfcA
MVHVNLFGGVLSPSLQALDLYSLLGITAALVLGGMVKGVTGIGVPLVAMPILSQLLPIKQAVLLLSMPIILGNIPQALEGGEMLSTVRRIAPLLVGTVLGNVVGVTILISLDPHRAQAAAGVVLIFAAALLLASPRLTLSPAWVKPVGFALGFGSALMESIASVPGPLLATYLIASGATGRIFTKQIAIILVVSIVTLITTFSGRRSRERCRLGHFRCRQRSGHCRHGARAATPRQNSTIGIPNSGVTVRSRCRGSDDLEIRRVAGSGLAHATFALNAAEGVRRVRCAPH